MPFFQIVRPVSCSRIRFFRSLMRNDANTTNETVNLSSLYVFSQVVIDWLNTTDLTERVVMLLVAGARPV